MTRRLRTAAWATGVVGSAALRRIIAHPQLEPAGMRTVGYHCVNAVPDVCAAPNPGIKTFLDLPMTTGRMGTHRTASRDA